MTLDRPVAGTALLCDTHGIIQQVIRDELGFGPRLARGRPLMMIVDQGSMKKMRNFIAELRTQGATFGWELNTLLDGQLTTLHFAGGTAADSLLIVGAKTPNGALQLQEELMRMNNEQMNALRAAFKDRSELARTQTEHDGAMYNELSYLNNELITLQRELAKKNVELERLNRLKNQFLGMAAHDLRNPLHLVLAYSDFLVDEASDALDDEHVKFLSVIQSSSQFMLNLVNDLLDVSAIESGKLQLDRQPTDLAALIERNVAMNGVLAERKEITLSFRHDGTACRILIDPAKIDQVLNNLLSNAVKYSYPGDQVMIGMHCQGNEAVISVQDEGQGIPAEEQDQLFKVFGRTSVQSTQGEKSTGLGLAISRRIVEEHGGRIWVESEEGEGATFYVALPIES